MKPPFPLLLVGCGRISKNHVAAIQNHPDLSLAGVCDPVTERARAVAEPLGIPWEDTPAKLFARTDTNAVGAVICTPSGLHPAHGVLAANAGLHVISEKPMATRLKDADELIHACDAAGRLLFVVKQNRLNPSVRLLRQAMEAGRFGRLYSANATVRWQRPQEYYDMAPWRGTWEFDGGAFMNQASHYVDLIHWLMGPVESVVATTATLARRIEAEDIGSAILRFRNGAIGTIETTMLAYPKNLEGSITILGQNGSVKIGGTALNKIDLWEFADYHDMDREADALRQAPDPFSVYGSGHAPYYDNVARVFAGTAQPGTDGREGRKSLELILGIYKAARTNRAVSLPLVEA